MLYDSQSNDASLMGQAANQKALAGLAQQAAANTVRDREPTLSERTLSDLSDLTGILSDTSQTLAGLYGRYWPSPVTVEGSQGKVSQVPNGVADEIAERIGALRSLAFRVQAQAIELHARL